MHFAKYSCMIFLEFEKKIYIPEEDAVFTVLWFFLLHHRKVYGVMHWFKPYLLLWQKVLVELGNISPKRGAVIATFVWLPQFFVLLLTIGISCIYGNSCFSKQCRCSFPQFLKYWRLLKINIPVAIWT